MESDSLLLTTPIPPRQRYRIVNRSASPSPDLEVKSAFSKEKILYLGAERRAITL
jgi:hypothetical protein